MIPTGDFDRFNQDILACYENEEITFGILIADPRQNDTREYIYNYLSVFHDKSKNLFNFFIPGYAKIIYRGEPYALDGRHETTSVSFLDKDSYQIISRNIGFQFNKHLFDDFCNKLEAYFGIKYTFNPMLILMSMKPGYTHTARYIVIELDNNIFYPEHRSGKLFLDLFDIVRIDTDLEKIHDHLIKTYIKGNLLDTIINAIKIKWLSEINKRGKEISRYRIKKVDEP